MSTTIEEPSALADVRPYLDPELGLIPPDTPRSESLTQHLELLEEPVYAQAWAYITEKLRPDLNALAPEQVKILQDFLRKERPAIAGFIAPKMALKDPPEYGLIAASAWEIAASTLVNHWSDDLKNAGTALHSKLDKVLQYIPQGADAYCIGTVVTFLAENIEKYTEWDDNHVFDDTPIPRIKKRDVGAHEPVHAAQNIWYDGVKKLSDPAEIKEYLQQTLEPNTLQKIDLSFVDNEPQRDPDETRPEPIRQIQEAQAEAVGLHMVRESDTVFGETRESTLEAAQGIHDGRSAQNKKSYGGTKTAGLEYSQGSFFLRRAETMATVAGIEPAVFATLALKFPEFVPNPGESPATWVQRCTHKTTGAEIDLADLVRCDRLYLHTVGPDNPAVHITPEGASGSGWMGETGDPVPPATGDAGHPPQALAALGKVLAQTVAPNAIPTPGAKTAAVGTPSTTRSAQKR